MAVLVASGLLQGCLPQAVREHAAMRQEFVPLSGTVEWDAPVQGPVVLFVSAWEDLNQVVFYKVIDKPRPFLFRLPPGAYRLWAIEDADRDFLCEPGERGVDASPPELRRLSIESRLDGLLVRVEADSRIALEAPIDLQRLAFDQTLSLYRRTLENLGQTVSLDDPRFEPEWAGKGTSAPLEFLETIGAGTYLLEPWDRERIPVLFVHGMNGTPRDFRRIIERLDQRRFQAWAYHYPTGFSLSIIGRYLNDTIEELHVRFGFQRMYVVAHSAGGLVARFAVQQNAHHGHRYIQKFLTISTPWQGHGAARLGVRFASAAVPAWHDMVPDSPFLFSLLEEPLPPHVQYEMFFSYRGASIFAAGADDGSVSLSSQLDPRVQDAADHVYGFDETHNTVLDSPEVAERLNAFLR